MTDGEQHIYHAATRSELENSVTTEGDNLPVYFYALSSGPI